jgi:hypothetical protein
MSSSFLGVGVRPSVGVLGRVLTSVPEFLRKMCQSDNVGSDHRSTAPETGDARHDEE